MIQKTVGFKPATAEAPGSVYCPICTHTVEAIVVADRKGAKVKPGQKCSRCNSTLDAGFVVRLNRAA